MKELEKPQQIQEAEYTMPYHWRYQDSSNSTTERLYFGYLGLCKDILLKHPPEERRNMKVLDAGCGDGRFLGMLADTGAQLYGTDYSESAIAFSRLLVPQAEFSAADLRELPYADGTFDIIYLIETLEHIPPEVVPDIVYELARVLKPDGKLVVTVPSDHLPPGPKHYQHFSPASLRTALATAFSVNEMMGQDRTTFHPLKLLYALTDNKLFEIRPLKRWYNRRIWPKYFNRTEPDSKVARRLIAISSKVQK
jgi:SAM-dependent methyltransferase